MLNIDLSPSERYLFNRLEKNLSFFKNTLVLLRNVSEENDISYLLIKDCNTVRNVPRDVDIFVRPNEKERTINVLEKEGMECTHRDNIETTLVGKDCLPIDLYTRICYFTNEFLDEDFLFGSMKQNEVLGESYPGLDTEAEFLLSLLHSLFGHRRLLLLDFLHLTNLKNSGLNLRLCKNYAHRKKWASILSLALDRINFLGRKVYIEKKDVRFPYLFDKRLILRCISLIDGLNLSLANRFFVQFSLSWDETMLKYEKSSLYNAVREVELLRKTINFLGYFIRRIRGDIYS